MHHNRYTYRMVHGHLVGDNKDFFITKMSLLDAEPSEHNPESDPNWAEVTKNKRMLCNEFQRCKHRTPLIGI